MLRPIWHFVIGHAITAGKLPPAEDWTEVDFLTPRRVMVDAGSEMKRAERYEHLYDQERKLRLEAENKCANCPFVKRAHEEFMDKRADDSKQAVSNCK